MNQLSALDQQSWCFLSGKVASASPAIASDWRPFALVTSGLAGKKLGGPRSGTPAGLATGRLASRLADKCKRKAGRSADSFDVGRGRFAAFPEGAHKVRRRSLPPFRPSPHKRPVIRRPDGATQRGAGAFGPIPRIQKNLGPSRESSSWPRNIPTRDQIPLCREHGEMAERFKAMDC